ncbi:hypothetical protein mRhiFer1_008849 [Rhinolophus ferrumequinum]|uniref:Uncharacterized protein n=1 Tax=Rhinolophus ferrumequinum TaxID=59479 RepID=A0A7J8AG32_RHIFE|nr:hypothetical protein mRhiFer1_008849 [Rhinolophus ferrumequinum]
MSTPTSKFQGTKAPEALDATNPHPALSSQVALVDFLCDSKVESAEVVRVGNRLPSIDGIHLGSMTSGFIRLEKGGGGTEEGRRSPRQNSKFRGTGPTELWKQESGLGCTGSKSQGFHGWQASSRKFS